MELVMYTIKYTSHCVRAALPDNITSRYIGESVCWRTLYA